MNDKTVMPPQMMTTGQRVRPGMTASDSVHQATFVPAARDYAAALTLILIGGWLRLRELPSMEFKADEQLALQLGGELLAARPWATAAEWPTHGMLSSNNVGNAPLFTWLVAGLWRASADPVWVAAAIAVANILCLYPLWRWALRHMGPVPALIMLAVMAVSPLPVMYSRKIWTQSVLCIGVVLTLWAIEWWGANRPWRALALGLLAVLFLGQLHQSGPIALAVLPLALIIQRLFDWRSGRTPRPWSAPTATELAVVAAALGAMLFFWVPYLTYLSQLSGDVLRQRPVLPSMSLDVVARIVGHVRLTDVIDFFPRDVDDFVADPIRRSALTACTWLGTPLAILGVWRWWRAPQRLPVVGFWWIGVSLVFILARIPVHSFYVLVLMPLPALLVSGAFDGTLGRRLTQALTVMRIAYAVALLVFTITMQNWIFNRGGATFGSTGGYGVAYSARLAQARAIVGHVHSDGGVESVLPPDQLDCHRLPQELLWLSNWAGAEAGTASAPHQLQLCDGFIGPEGSVKYQWRLMQ
jgi:hypothetical protein